MSEEKKNSTQVETSKKKEEQIKPQPIKKSASEQLGHSAKAEEYALTLSQKLDLSRINIDRLQIKINDQVVFSMKNGDLDRKQTNISDKQAEMIKQALKDPGSFEGSMKITQGGKTLLHIKDGKVLIDSARLVEESAKVELNTPDPDTKEMYQKYSENVKNKGLAKTKQTAVNAFEDGVDKEDITKMLKAEDPEYKKMLSSSNELKANKSLNQIVNSAIAQSKINSQAQSQSQSKQIQEEKTAAKTSYCPAE